MIQRPCDQLCHEFPSCYDGSNKGAGLFLAHSLRNKFIMAEKAWWLVCEVTGHTEHTVRKERVTRKWGWVRKPEGPFTPEKL